MIRDFKTEDFETLWWIDQQCFPPEIAYSQQELRTYIRRRGSFTVVAVNPQAADHSHREGACPASLRIGGFLVAQGGLTGHIITIDVLKAARRSGVGSLLLRSAEDRLAMAGSRAVSLETGVDNLSALAFYKRHGYSVIGTWPRYYPNGVDALMLEKKMAMEEVSLRGS